MTMDILFTHSYFLKLDPKEHRAMMPYAPLGTLYAAALARQNGFTCALFDAMLAEGAEDIGAAIERYAPRFVVVYDDDFNYLTKMCLQRMRHAAFSMCAIAKARGCVVVVHGSDAADHAADYLAHGADAVVVGEGELSLVELLKHYSSNIALSPDGVRGVAYNNGRGVVFTPHRDVVHDLDTLPFAAWDLVEVERYRALWKPRHGYFSMNIVTTRGCPYHCNWCAKPIYGQMYNSRSPENVVEEMIFLRDEYHPDHLWFCDDIFGLRPGWVKSFSDEVVRHKVSIPFKCLSRADLLAKKAAVEDLQRAGCATVWIGAESGSQQVLDAMEKGTTIQQIRDSSLLLHEHGIRVGFFLQYGYPGETRGDIERTLQMVKECMPDEIGVSVSYPLPGTRFYENVKAQLGDKRNWDDSEDLAHMFTGPFSPDFYRALHRVTHKKFRLWQGIDQLKSLAHDPRLFSRVALRRIAAAGYHAFTLPNASLRMNDLAKLSHGS